MKKNALLTALFSIFFTLPLCAIEWSKIEIEQHAYVGETLAPYVFTFTNTGAAPITITDMRISCGCLEPELNKKQIASGESGTLTVKFDRTGLFGDVDRTVTVTTDEKNRAEPYELILRANLPEAITLAPRLLTWKQTAPTGTKSVDITVSYPNPIEITGATANKDTMDVKLVTLEHGRHYRLDVTPKNIAEKGIVIIALQTAEPLPAGTAVTIYVQVR